MRSKPSRRRRFALVIGLVLTTMYVGSYYRLSRRGLREASGCGLSGFLYVPYVEAEATEDLSKHRSIGRFYAPINQLDRLFYRDHYPVECIMWRLSG